MLLSNLFKNAPNIEIKQLSSDSRIPMKDAIFFCVKGYMFDGHDYIKEAIDNGAKVIVYDKPQIVKYNAIYIKVNSVDETIKKVALKYYGFKDNELETYVVSGCYGRSSVSTFIYYYINKIKPCGYIGRFGIKYSDTSLTTTFPTLTSLDNIRYIKTMSSEGMKAATFEASASSLSYNKLNIINPNVFVYTNTSKDSPDYIEDMNNYFKDIRNYLYSLENDTTLILNIDDISYDEFKDADIPIYTYGTSEGANFKIRQIFLSKNGIRYSLMYNNQTYIVTCRLQGIANVYNLTAAIASLVSQGYDIEHVISTFINVPSIEGVFESIDNEYHIIVDCANTIDSINDLLQYARFVSKDSRVIGVCGISARDDKIKLKDMMELCEKYLDVVVLTEENVNKSDINKMLETASTFLTQNKTIKIETRNVAIESAVELLNKNDTLVLMGMGNEKSMLKGLGKQPYLGDKEYALYYLNKRRKEENEII